MSLHNPNVAGWSSGAELTSSQMNDVGTQLPMALDKTTAGDTLSGVVALASTAELNLQYAGNVVVMEGRYAGTFLATGKVLDAQVSHVLSVRDGRLVKFQQYTDTLHWAEVMTP